MNIDEKRELKIVKSNELIRKGRFNLSLIEQKIVLCMISRITPGMAGLEYLDFEIKDFCNVCGIQYKQNLSQLKDCIKTLSDKSMWFNLPNGQQTLIRWIEKPYLDYGTGLVRIRLDRDLTPYLIGLKNNFTEYQLISVLTMKSKYSIKLYELLKSYSYLGRYEVGITELKECLVVDEKYSTTTDFNRYIISKAIGEINDYTDIEVSVSYIYSGRRITGYVFEISKQLDNVNVLARAELAGRRPRRSKREKAFKEFAKEYRLMEELEGQLSLMDMDMVNNLFLENSFSGLTKKRENCIIFTEQSTKQK